MQRSRRFLVLVAAVTSLALAVPAGAAVDTTPPNGTITAPAPGQVLTSTSVTLRGSATDNVAVSAVHVAVINR
ncbi:MAG: Ig-like domain-containing protein, partial [Actinomycetota bacterium]